MQQACSHTQAHELLSLPVNTMQAEYSTSDSSVNQVVLYDVIIQQKVRAVLRQEVVAFPLVTHSLSEKGSRLMPGNVVLFPPPEVQLFVHTGDSVYLP